MTIFLSIAILVLLISMGLLLIRACAGPTVYDRLLAASSFSTHIMLFIALLAFATETFALLDIALIYALVNFITTIALLRYIPHGTTPDSP